MIEILICSVVGCDSPVRTRELCNKHYKRLRRNGTTERLQKGGNPKAPKTEICKGSDCDRIAVGKGFCLMHYKRLRRNGDPDVVTMAPVGSRLQRVLDSIAADPIECDFFPNGTADSRPATVAYEGRTMRAHRLVLFLTEGPPTERGLHACHSCGNGHLGCISRRHLRYDTPTGNAADKLDHGTNMQGESCWKAKLTADDIPTIRLRWDRGETMDQIAADYPVGPKNIWAVANRKTWKHIV